MNNGIDDTLTSNQARPVSVGTPHVAPVGLRIIRSWDWCVTPSHQGLRGCVATIGRRSIIRLNEE
ncbi:MAG TPA: hypothetical protein PK176_13330, partial [Acidobacteriota bacterium]|nr:hypothetical protein [Acidobacteriota bacterium]HQM64285.1 hypothetical protein [Acidobacteriota bacterium]